MLVIRIMPLCGVRDLLPCHPPVPVTGGGDAAEFAGSEPCKKTARHGEPDCVGRAWGCLHLSGVTADQRLVFTWQWDPLSSACAFRDCTWSRLTYPPWSLAEE